MRRYLKRKVRRLFAIARLHDIRMNRLRREDPAMWARLMVASQNQWGLL